MQTAALLQADPRAANIARQIRAQQKIVAPKGIVIPEAYIDEMAQAFVRQYQIGDALDIKGTWMDWTYRGEYDQPANYVYVMTRRDTVVVPGPPSADWSQAIGIIPVYGLDGTNASGGIATSRDGKLDFFFLWSPEVGVPIFYVAPHEKDMGFFDYVGPIILAAASLNALPLLIGQTALGAEFAASYPTIAKAVGTASMQLVMTGDLDIGRTIASTVTSIAGAETGAFVAETVDSAAAGAIAQAATTAAIAGKDVTSAAARAAFLSLGSAMDDDAVQLTEVTLDDLGLSDVQIDVLNALGAAEDELFNYGFTGNELFSDPWGTLVTIDGDVAALSDQEWADSYYVASDGSVRDVTNRIVIPGPEASTLTEEQIAQSLLDNWAGQQGATVTTQPGDPARPEKLPQTTTQTKIPSLSDAAKTADALLKTAVSMANSIKLITTGRPLTYATNPIGMPRTTLPGVSITRPDGSIVTNNGNGTQTIRYPDGRVQTVSTTGYTGGGTLIPGVSNQTLLIGGAILVGAVLLARRK